MIIFGERNDSMDQRNPLTEGNLEARKRRRSLEIESPPKPEKAPPIPINDGEDFVSRVFREVT